MTDPNGGSHRPLTIVHIASYYIPSLGYQENFLPFEQAALGHEVHILTGDRYAPHPSYDTVYEPRVGPRMVGEGTHTERDVSIHRLPVPIELTRHNNPWITGTVARLDQLKPDIIHLHGVTPLCSLGVMFSGAAKRYAVVCDHHLCRFNLEPATPIKRAYYATFRALLSAPAMKRVKAWLPINEDAQQVLSEVIGINGDNVVINRLGVDNARFNRDAAAGRSWRQENAISERATLFLHAGRLEPRKRIEDLITAFATILSRQSDGGYCLCIVGDGDATYIHDLKNQVSSLGISGHTKFLAIQPHEKLPELFNAADLGVWPGDVSVTMIEAMGTGLPVVLPENPGLSYVADCVGADTFERGDVDGLAERLLRRAATRETQRGEIAAACAARLGWRAIASQTIDIYRDVMARSLT